MDKVFINTMIVRTEMNKRGTCPLRFSWTLNGKQFAVSARITIEPEYWDQSSQTFRRKCPDRTYYSTQLNDKIEKLEELIEKSINSIAGFSFENVKVQFKHICQGTYDDYVNKQKGNEKKTCNNLIECIDEFIRVKEKASPSTAKRMRLTKEKLVAYKFNIDFQDFDEEFYLNFFKDYLEGELGLELGTIDGHIAAVKNICNFAKKNFPAIYIPTNHESYKRKKGASKEKIAITKEEAKLIINYETINEYESYVKDYFSVGYLTGLRFSDIQALKAEYFEIIEDQYYYDAISIKNQKALRFPIRPEVVEILKKYDFNMKQIDITTMNRIIKKIAKKIGGTFLNKVRVKAETFEGTKYEFKDRYSLLSTHTGRHTFATLFMIKHGHLGMSALKKLSEVLGHSSVQITADIYWKIDTNESDKLLLA